MNSSKRKPNSMKGKKRPNRRRGNKNTRRQNKTASSINDSRFDNVLHDPRFNEMETPDNDNVKLDSRFAEMFSNPAFAMDNCTLLLYVSFCLSLHDFLDNPCTNN